MKTSTNVNIVNNQIIDNGGNVVTFNGTTCMTLAASWSGVPLPGNGGLLYINSATGGTVTFKALNDDHYTTWYFNPGPTNIFVKEVLTGGTLALTALGIIK